jgi:hypothetical protein
MIRDIRCDIGTLAKVGMEIIPTREIEGGGHGSVKIHGLRGESREIRFRYAGSVYFARNAASSSFV